MSGNVLAVDVGSSALKAVLFADEGKVLAARTAPIATNIGANRSHTQDPDNWWHAFKDALCGLPHKQTVKALVFTGSMQNLIALTPQGRPLGPAALYSDRRLDPDELTALEDRLPETYASHTGNRPDPAHTIFKLMCLDRFLLNAGPDTARRYFFGAKDAVSFRLTGRAAIDPTVASTTGLMNLAAHRWDTDLLAVAGVTEEQLPEILPADEILAELPDDCAAELGLPPGIPVFNGAGDAAAATWGAGADKPGHAYAYLGTTGWVAATLPLSEAKPPRDVYTLADPMRADHVIIVSPFLSAGASMDWLAEVTGSDVGALLDAAGSLGDAATPPMFLPYLSGERSPFEDQNVRASFLGLDRTHGIGAMAHAVLEGIAWATRHNLETIGAHSSPLPVIGGAARDPLQRRILANTLKCDVVFPDGSQEMTALGVYRMIAAKVGLRSGTVTTGPVISPTITDHAHNQRRFEGYLAASRFMRDHARRLM